MKKTKESGTNRIWKFVAAGCIAFVALICGAGIWFLNAPEKPEQEAGFGSETSLTADSNVLVKDVEAVKAQEAMMGSSFSDYADDGRKPIRIVEVIPHPICSVFPYLVEWETVEGYDENTFLGYEAMRRFVIKATQSGATNQYAIVKEGTVTPTLENYSTATMISKGNWQYQDGWWRETKIDENIMQVNGYFEYVGDKKGLYHINTDKLLQEGEEGLGIRYDIMAMKRKGSEDKQGEWEVDGAQYYWAKDYADATYPDGPDGAIEQKTGYNYDLQFTVGDLGGQSASYHVQNVSVNVSDMLTVTEGYEYAAVLKAGADWDGGYVYSKAGNYEVESFTEVFVDADTDLAGKYIRINNDEKADDSGLEDGYFRLCTSADNLITGDVVYTVTFAEAAAGKMGSYILMPSAVQSAIKQDASTALTDILFEYVGETKGNYDVAFMYGPGTGAGALYSAELLEVSNGNGRYALTSTVAEEELLYTSVGEGGGDYSKVITAIDCAGIDYTLYAESEQYKVETIGYYATNTKLPGLCAGATDNGDWASENGDWVFYEVDSDEVNGFTRIEEFENGKVPKRIYVYGQNRKNRYYVRTGFENSEWFKLLMYLSTDDGSEPLAYQDYAAGALTPIQIKEKYASDIEAFNRTYRIEIIQKTPGQLTVDDVEKADMLFFATEVGLPQMTHETWNSIIREYNLGSSKGLTECSSNNILYSDDLSTDALMAIYDNCLYERTTALVFSGEDIGWYAGDSGLVSTNLGKMAVMANLFDDPSAFAYFLDGDKYEYNEDYTAIDPKTGQVKTYIQSLEYIGNLYNLGRTYLENQSDTILMGAPIVPNKADPKQEASESNSIDPNAWHLFYFWVVEVELDANNNYQLKSGYSEGNGMYGWNWGAHSWWNFRGLDVTEEDRVWYIPSGTADTFSGYSFTRNVWKILHNKKSKETSEPVVIVTNADGDNISELENVTPVYYYYVDAFALGSGNEEFDIEFMINWRPEEVDEPNALTNVTVSRSGGGMVYSLDSPSYKTKYVCNVAGDFIKDGTFDYTINSRDYEITATDSAGKTDTVIVRFIVRETFMLN